MSQFWKTVFTLFATLHFTQAWQLVCYKGSLSNSYNVTVENATLLIKSGYIDITKPTVICTHGYNGTISTQGINQITAIYLLLGGYNVCALDYSKEAIIGPIPGVNYVLAVIVAAYGVAEGLAQLLWKLVLLGFNVKTLHLIGHSLGAHVFGNTGTFFKKMTDISIYRITGLDPAGPGFDGNSYILLRLSKEDADFVDIIHTDYAIGRYGITVPTAHQDYFACPHQYEENEVQPGCPPVGPAFTTLLNMTPQGACSHRRSVDLYVEAVQFKCELLAAQAESEADFDKTTFVANITICIGEYTNQTYRGNFYFRTNDRSPYGLGEAGLTAQ